MELEVNIDTIHKALTRASGKEEPALRTVYRRALQEKWVARQVNGKGRGGKAQLYLSTMLPPDVQSALKDFSAPVEQKKRLPVAGTKKELEIGPAQEAKSIAKMTLAEAYLERIGQAKFGQKGLAKKRFIEGYNLGEAGTFPAVFKHVGPVDVRGKTIDGWVRRLRENFWDSACLLDQRGFVGRGKRAVTPEQMEIILAIVQSPYNVPGKPVQEIIRQATMVMESRGIKPLSDSTYRRWLTKDWIPNNYDQWIFWREGEKGLNDKVLFNLIRDSERLEAGDLLVADGHVLNFEVVSPTTKRPKRMMLVMFSDFKSNYPLGWEIAESENTEAISIALRRAILRLGKIPKAIYIDNGRAFKGKYFINNEEEEMHLKGVYRRLGVEHVIVAWPYHGQSKPIERTFGVMAELERCAPSYVGTSINNKPAHLNRGEKLRRKLHQKMTQGATPSLEEAHRAIAFWVDQYVNRPMGSSSKFPGRTPDELMVQGPGVDPVALRCLMMKTTSRLIRQDGVQIDGEWYYDPALYGKRFKVYCRYDFLHRDSVLIYEEETNKFICEAFKVKKVHPMVTYMGSEADKAEYERQIRMKQTGRKMTVATAREIVETQVLPEARQRFEAAGFTLEGGHVDGTKALPAPDKPKVISKAEKEKIKAQLETLECEHDSLPGDAPGSCTGNDGYEPEILNEAAFVFARIKDLPESERFEKLIELEVRGWLIPREQQAFMKYFEQSTEYERYRDHFETHRVRMTLLHEVETTGTEN